MMRMRMSQTMTATKMGTTLTRVAWVTTLPPRDWWLTRAMETPHQVSSGVHGGCQQPGAEQVPDFLGLIGALFGGEQAGDAGEVDAAEGDGEDGGPAEGGEA